MRDVGDDTRTATRSGAVRTLLRFTSAVVAAESLDSLGAFVRCAAVPRETAGSSSALPQKYPTMLSGWPWSRLAGMCTFSR